MYATKAGVVARLDPVINWLIARGVSADVLTLAAVPVAVLGGLCLLASPAVTGLLLVVPFLAAARLVLNLLDGAVARRTGQSHPRGELYNEVGDRLADVAFLAPVAVLPGASPVIVLGGVMVAVLASYAGVTAKAAGGERIYRGILAKPERMALLSAAAIAAFVSGPDVWGLFGPVLLVGATLTLLERVVVALRRLQ